MAGMRHAELRGWLESLVARKKALILATCHSGVGKSKVAPEVAALFSRTKGSLVPLEQVSEGTLVLAASTRDETAREDDLLKGDIYTHFLLEGLAVFDRNKDGSVSVLEAHDYARQKTYVHTKGRQKPTLETQMIGEADFALRGRKETQASVAILEGYGKVFQGFEVEVNGRAKGELPFAFPLEPGVNRVSVFAPGSSSVLVTYEVDVEAGEKIDLATLSQPPPWHLSLSGHSQKALDKRASKVASNGSLSLTEVSVTYSVLPWLEFGTLGFSSFVASFQSIAPGISAALSLQGIALTGQTFYDLTSYVNLGTQAGLGLEQANLEFSDVASGEKVGARSVSPYFEARLFGRFFASGKFNIDAGFQTSWSRQRFGEFGHLALARTGFLVGVSLGLGGKRKRL